MNFKKLPLTLMLAITPAFAAFAEPEFPRDYSKTIDLREHIGKTFLETLLTPIVGIDAEMDASVYKPVTIKPSDEVLDIAEESFDERVTERLYRYFAGGRTGAKIAISTFSGQEIVPAEFRERMRPIASLHATEPSYAGRATGTAAAMSLLASGAGTLVIIDENNHYYNVGYQDPDVTTGRSFAASHQRKLLDATHREYLRALNAALNLSTTSSQDYYRQILDILTATDTRGVSALPKETQIAIADFLSVYNAELSRHEMADLGTASPWGIDLAQVTFLAGYTAKANMAMIKDGFEPGDIEDYILKSIGNTKPQFTRLSRLITTYAAQPHKKSQLIDRLNELTPIHDSALASEVRGDVFRRVLFFLNREETQELARENGPEISNSLLELLDFIETDHAEITQHVKGCVDGTKKFGCFGGWL